MQKYISAKKHQLSTTLAQLETTTAELEGALEREKGREEEEKKKRRDVDNLEAELSVAKEIISSGSMRKREEVEELERRLKEAEEKLENAMGGVILKGGEVVGEEEVMRLREVEREGGMLIEKVMGLKKEKNDLKKVFINLKKKYEAVVHEMENNKVGYIYLFIYFYYLFECVFFIHITHL